ncbi:Ldh family oxidoreductase [Tuwongella immobilis]|uniref:Ldh family oxidoreductase n=1 Tax=Tuwongella immobilis TaxID=692036 RepID=A0A6C2YSI9_9BACT|nr:Ldh family oxidoreductase [Tuwongella immobilis]VIP04341.1 dehydrogenase : Malate/lactate dehydrogenase OS=Singulisphaera acidiphila (strain ATCC BAA-1392 / DSM 18658 / VKM B-2454 / MOB10) GN=Sinac_6642 PE=4 SV=1: Ldh_2 [Tuwongella immobilis]VTS06044.1 dehydrogenase : Malate/lactate dehydrogenase OS=Singulisphaera acidiphila (strain ATCC BAA-1392 / DSM 18658 / VKM B-2454 / MOB10) GN=Sinac_6642 PE=4 SV=1: Ldh_2 [Tuwongella immobilis]
MPTFRPQTLIDVSCRLFERVGIPPADARLVATSLVDANLCGHDSHGVMRVPQYAQNIREGKLTADAPFTILHETPAMLAADAGWGLGQVHAHRLLDHLIPKAKTLGIAAGTLRRCGHTGRLGEYAERLASEHLAFFGTVNSHGAGRRVAPPGGTEGRISTNPLVMGAPTPGDPVVLDIGTSVVAEGKVRVHFQKKEPVPEGWLHDHQGQPTTDPSVLYTDPRGTILPIGAAQAYKGFGLGLMLDLFAGGLSGGECSRSDAPMAGLGNCLLFVVMDTRHFGGTDHFLAESGRLTEYVRNCPKAAGVSAITLPGDPERHARQQRSGTGLSIPAGTWELFEKLAAELGIELPAADA